MKKIILTFAVLIVAAFTFNGVYAQKIGLRAGVGFANVKYTEGSIDLNPESKLGLTAGLKYEMKVLGKFIRLTPELLVDVKGLKGDTAIQIPGVTGNWETTTTKVSGAYNYVGAGLGVKVKAPLLPVYAVAQPYYQYMISAKSFETDANGEIQSTDIDLSNDPDLKRSEFGVNVALGTQFQAGPVGLYIEGRYSVPMTSLEQAYEWENYTTNIRNRYFTFAIGILLGN